MCICINIYTNIQVYIHTWCRRWSSPNMNIYIHIYVYTYTYVYTDIYLHIYIYAYTPGVIDDFVAHSQKKLHHTKVCMGKGMYRM